jgi:hypothetical protein
MRRVHFDDRGAFAEIVDTDGVRTPGGRTFPS